MHSSALILHVPNGQIFDSSRVCTTMKERTCLALIRLRAPLIVSLESGLSIKCLMTSTFHFSGRPSSVREYSRATVSSSTPQRDRIKAQITPVRSFPAVQWMIIGLVGSFARCSNIVLYEVRAPVSRMLSYARVNPYLISASMTNSFVWNSILQFHLMRNLGI